MDAGTSLLPSILLPGLEEVGRRGISSFAGVRQDREKIKEGGYVVI